MDPQHPEHEKELEAFYMNFAQPNSLTMKQCLTLAIQVVKEGAYGLGGWQGEWGPIPCGSAVRQTTLLRMCCSGLVGSVRINCTLGGAAG